MEDDVVEQGDEADEAGASDGASQLIPGVLRTVAGASVTTTWLRRTAFSLGIVTSAGCFTHSSPRPSVALGRLHTIAASLQRYHEQCGGFPEALAKLGPADDIRTRSCERLGLITDAYVVQHLFQSSDPVFGGYRWHYKPIEEATGSPARIFRRYEIRVTWIAKEGIEDSLWTNELGLIHFASGREASGTDPVLE
jgi:hypothetical protein